jgi:hypothetical protein
LLVGLAGLESRFELIVNLDKTGLSDWEKAETSPD